jgi:hypothetical protein
VSEDFDVVKIAGDICQSNESSSECNAATPKGSKWKEVPHCVG